MQIHTSVDGQPDGKVKAELGEDPERRGEYQFAFQIHNLEDRAKTFSLSADVFTQDHFVSYANGNQDETQLAQYMDLTTTALDADVSWTAGGKTVLPEEELAACDFNGDGKTNGDDAQALLDLRHREARLHPESPARGPGRERQGGDL